MPTMAGMSLIRIAARTRVVGVIYGRDSWSGADFSLKLAEASQNTVAATDIILEQPYVLTDSEEDKAAARPMHLLDLIQGLRERGASLVVLPSFGCYTCIGELKATSPLPIADMLEALVRHVTEQLPEVRRLGVLTSPQLREQGVLERYFGPAGIEVLHPSHGVADAHMAGPEGLRSLHRGCTDLVRQGAQRVLPTQMPLTWVARQMPHGTPLIDVQRVYARYVVHSAFSQPLRPFKLGVVGGVGPAATVDFLGKLVRHTPSQRDQDHIKVVVEQNPQIPDRTDYLLGQGADPTLALYATCRQLQAGGADLIAIPCNTAHAFIERIQPHLAVPVVNMLTATARHIRGRFPELRAVGLIATSGTIGSGIYRQALHAQGLEEIVPPTHLQACVMNAVYGPQGIKAGYHSGACIDELSRVIENLALRGARVVILGCSELPLVLSPGEGRSACGLPVTFIDPAEILAIHCVARARQRGGASHDRRHE